MNSRALPHQIFQDPSPSHFEAEGQRSIFPRLDSLVCLLPLGLRLRENRSPVSAAGAPGSNLPPLAIMIMEIILGAPSLQICAVSILSVV